MNLRSNSLPGYVDPLATHTKEPHHPLPLPVTHCPSSTCLVPWPLDLPLSASPGPSPALFSVPSVAVAMRLKPLASPSLTEGIKGDPPPMRVPSVLSHSLRCRTLVPSVSSIPLHRPPASSRLSPQPPPPPRPSHLRSSWDCDPLNPPIPLNLPPDPWPCAVPASPPSPRLPRSPPRTPPPLLGLLTGQNRWLAGCFSPRLYPPLRSWTCLARTQSRPTGLSVTSRSPSAGGPLGRCASRSRFLRPLLCRSFPPLGSAPTELLLCFSWP